MAKNPIPNHGTRNRYRAPFNCRCIACVRRLGAVDADYIPTWPAQMLESFFGLPMLRMWFDEGVIANWREEGVSDVDADTIAIKLGVMPNDIWSGYTSAGLDFPDAR